MVVFSLMKSPKLKELLTNLSLLIVSLAALFIFLETAARLLNILPAPLCYFRSDFNNNPSRTTGRNEISRKKGNNTFRIFIFGGSNVYLQSYYLLGELLAREFPLKRFEIINAGINTYGTNRIVPILKASTEYDPDMFILYSGHNEFLETFLQDSMPGSLIRPIHRKLARLKSYALLYKTLGMFMGNLPAPLMERLTESHLSWSNPLSDKEKDRIYRRYESNIREMIEIARSKNIPMILSTAAYNYVDDRYVSPLYYSSRHLSTRHSEGQIAIEDVSDEDIIMLATKPRKDPYLENRLGKYYLEKQDYKKAAEYFVSAARVDFQPFRSNSVTNGINRKISNDMNVPLADVESMIIRHSYNNIPDFMLFRDWCHLNEKGNRILQITLFNTIKELPEFRGLSAEQSDR